MSGTPRRFADDDVGVSEVIGYLFSFVIAFLILIASMATFNIIAESGDRLAAHAEFGDIANRVAAAVLDAFEIGSEARDTYGTVTSGQGPALLYTRTLDVPPEFRGFRYTVDLDTESVSVVSVDGQIQATSTTFKAGEVLPAPADDCTTDHIVCAIGGSVPAGNDEVVVSYHYDTTVSPPVNKIEIT